VLPAGKKPITDASKFIAFVLGAGASFEVDMPTGYELKAKIASSLSFKVDDFRRIGGGDDKLREAIHQISQRQGSEVTRGGHLIAANLIHAGMQQAPSIDNFIDSHRSNPQVAEVGKLAIASEILKAERASKLYVRPTNIYNKLKFEAVANTWFNAFFQLLTLNAQEEDLPERLKQVESPRELRRLLTLRRWSHEQEIKQIFTGSPRTSGTPGAGAPR